MSYLLIIQSPWKGLEGLASSEKAIPGYCLCILSALINSGSPKAAKGSGVCSCVRVVVTRGTFLKVRPSGALTGWGIHRSFWSSAFKGIVLSGRFIVYAQMEGLQQHGQLHSFKEASQHHTRATHLNTGGVETAERLRVWESITFRWCLLHGPNQASWKPSSMWGHTPKGFITHKHSVHFLVLPSHRDTLRSVLGRSDPVPPCSSTAREQWLTGERRWLASVVCDSNFSVWKYLSVYLCLLVI